MKKQTTYIIIAFLIGIILTQFLLRERHDAQEVKVLKEFAKDADVPAEPITNRKKTSTTVITVEPKPEVTHEPSAKVEDKVGPNEVAKDPKRVVELTLDESSLANLERNMDDLSNKVTLSREARGWRVHYSTSDNPMSSIGIINDDLVLYDVIIRAKANPKTAPLISRLETIFSTLER